MVPGRVLTSLVTRVWIAEMGADKNLNDRTLRELSAIEGTLLRDKFPVLITRFNLRRAATRVAVRLHVAVN